jgi:hypothetical protein
MTDQFWLLTVGVTTLFVGFWKAFHPMWWVDFRRRHPWYDKLDLHSFLYKGARAEKTVRLNGYGLIVFAVIVLVAVIFFEQPSAARPRATWLALHGPKLGRV